jgi:hypothetical protein
MSENAFCSPGVLAAFATVCWCATLVGGYLAAGAWHTAGVFFWFTLYWVTCRRLKGSGAYFLEELEGYPMWSYWSAIMNGAVVLPACCAAACVVSGAPSPFAEDFLLSRVEIGTSLNFWVAQGNAALCAGMLKDFVVYDRGMELHFALHHAVATFGLVLCLMLPAGAVIGSVNAVLAELGTQCYNYYVLSRFSRPSKALYFIGMKVSHVLVGQLTWTLMGLPSPLWMRIVYLIFCTLLVALRTVGWVMYAQKELSAAAGTKEPSPDPKKPL